MQARLPAMKSRSKGFSDLQSNVESPEANEVKQLISTLPREQYKPTIEELTWPATTRTARTSPASPWRAIPTRDCWWHAWSSATR